MHFDASNPGDVASTSLCGWIAVDVTSEIAEVTCAACARGVAIVHKPVCIQPTVSLMEEMFAEEPAVFGARELSRTGERAIAQSVVGTRPEPKGWPTAETAVRFFVSRTDEGASLRSTSDYARDRVQSSSTPGIGGSDHQAIDRTVTVARALDRAELDVDALTDACDRLTPSQARAVYVLRVGGQLTRRHTGYTHAPRKGWFTERSMKPEHEVIDIVLDRIGVAVTAHEVRKIRDHFTSAVTEALVASGEMRSPRSREMRRRGFQADPLAKLREQGGE